jgi:hypothetical protein
MSDRINIILDTDISGDVDDVGDVGIICATVKLGLSNLLGVVATTPFQWSGPCVAALLDYSLPGNNIPICRYDGATTLPQFSAYCEKVARRFGRKTDAFGTEFLGHVRGYRTMLHHVGDSSVTIAMTGTASSLSDLLLSGPDSVSPLTGAQLVASKVRALVWEAGRFPKSDQPEYNISTDVSAARALVDMWPSCVPIIWACNKIGDVVFTGPPKGPGDMISPYRYAYDLYTGHASGTRQAWGQVACYWAAFGYLASGKAGSLQTGSETLLEYGGVNGTVLIDELGNNFWRARPGNSCYLVTKAPAEKIVERFNELLAIGTSQ